MSDITDLGKALMQKKEYLLPKGDLGQLGKAILKNKSYLLPR